MKHFGIRDITNTRNGIVGIINYVPVTNVGITKLKNEIFEVVAKLLDTDDFSIDVVTLKDIKKYKTKELSIEVDGMNYFVELQELF